MLSDTPHHPGAFERHLRRRDDNPLFAPARRLLNDETLAAAREADLQSASDFNHNLQALLGEVSQLKANEESEVLLALKARLDHAYTWACTLEGEHEQAKQALLRLIELIMNGLMRGAEGDPQAQHELQQEAQARQTHVQLMQTPLAADLMLPDSAIPEDELLPTLLSCEAAELETALWLFEAEQLQSLLTNAETLLARVQAEGTPHPPGAEARLAQIAAQITAGG